MRGMVIALSSPPPSPICRSGPYRHQHHYRSADLGTLTHLWPPPVCLESKIEDERKNRKWKEKSEMRGKVKAWMRFAGFKEKKKKICRQEWLKQRERNLFWGKK
ncbi:hypothetical protein SLEP1_g55253 [Rubroshorea leprosula]|uniref:Uncharacterized protein n=1 Tax=Rubroshorea leprosula TaxID=152421 RepID=A0AAV5MFP9_9ROSI|nr:hypothetical protein SLEP1_g55253 [Rubroshorea leprosula]